MTTMRIAALYILALACLVGMTSRLFAADAADDSPSDLTDVLKAFAKQLAHSKGNVLQRQKAVDDFKEQIKKFEGKEVSCDFRLIQVYDNRVLLSSEGCRCVFLRGGKTLAALKKEAGQDFPVVFDLLVISDSAKPSLYSDYIGAVKAEFASALNVGRDGDEVVISGKVALDEYDRWQLLVFTDVQVRKK